MKNDKIIAKINSAEKAQLVEISQKLDVPVSQLIREGVRDVLEKHSELATVSHKSKRAHKSVSR